MTEPERSSKNNVAKTPVLRILVNACLNIPLGGDYSFHKISRDEDFTDCFYIKKYSH